MKEVGEFQFERDKRRFLANMAFAKAAENLMKKQRKELGLPESPKPMKIGNVTELQFGPQVPDGLLSPEKASESDQEPRA